VVIISSSLLILFLLTAWIVSGPGQEWRHVQNKYIDYWSEISDSISDASYSAQKKGIHQHIISEMNRVDRCVSCHLGMENPYMANAEQPFATHPGDFLLDHPVEGYGCTICHETDLRAVIESGSKTQVALSVSFNLTTNPMLA